MSLVARLLEAAGTPTVIAGTARDIVEYVGVPRFAFTDFPLGNPCGKPYDSEMQESIVRFALELLGSATAPNSTAQTPYRWSDDEAWRSVYARVDADNRDELLAMGERRRRDRSKRNL